MYLVYIGFILVCLFLSMYVCTYVCVCMFVCMVVYVYMYVCYTQKASCIPYLNKLVDRTHMANLAII